MKHFLGRSRTKRAWSFELNKAREHEDTAPQLGKVVVSQVQISLDMLRTVWGQEIVPQSWKTDRVIPPCKSGDTSNRNYWGITVKAIHRKLEKCCPPQINLLCYSSRITICIPRKSILRGARFHTHHGFSKSHKGWGPNVGFISGIRKPYDTTLRDGVSS
jgi:hypothetical protein